MKGLLIARLFVAVAGVLFVLGSIALTDLEGPTVAFLSLAVGTGLLLLANLPGYLIRSPGGRWAFERTHFVCSCLFLSMPLAVLFTVSLLCRR
jgi:hypothetical protein